MIPGLLLRGYIGEYKWDLAALLRSLEFIAEELYRSSV